MDTKYYIIQALRLPSVREWYIYDNWVSSDKDKLIEKVRKNLEEESLFEPTVLKETEGGWLLINGEPEKWLRIIELDKI